MIDAVDVARVWATVVILDVLLGNRISRWWRETSCHKTLVPIIRNSIDNFFRK